MNRRELLSILGIGGASVAAGGYYFGIGSEETASNSPQNLPVPDPSSEYNNRPREPSPAGNPDSNPQYISEELSEPIDGDAAITHFSAAPSINQEGKGDRIRLDLATDVNADEVRSMFSSLLNIDGSIEVITTISGNTVTFSGGESTHNFSLLGILQSHSSAILIARGSSKEAVRSSVSEWPASIN